MTTSYRDEILEHYITMLAMGWCVVDEEGNVSMVIGDVNLPATIDGKRIVLPTRDQMKNRDWEHRLGFHPLRESFNKGISPILSNMRDLYVQRLNTSIAYLMQQFVKLAKNTDGQKDLTTEQSQVLNALTQCNDATDKMFESLRKKTLSSSTSDQFVNIFIKKGGVVGGQTFGRAAITTFPIYQRLVEGADKINGVKVTGKEREMFKKLYQFIFKDIDKADGYNVGVSSKTAPFMEALMRGTIKVANDIDTVAEPYLPIVDIPYFVTFPENMNDWIDIFDDKDKAQLLANSIPNLSGNYADEDEKKPAHRDEPAASRPVERTESRSEPAAPVRPRGPMTMGQLLGGGKPPVVEPKPETKAPVAYGPSLDGRRVMTSAEMDREEQRKRREEEDRIRRERDREEEEDRELRRKRREEDERLDRERRERDRERDRDRDRGRDDRDRYDRDDRDYDRDYDRDRDRDRGRGRDDRDDRRTGDIFDDNPVLRSTLRREEDGRERGRGRYDRDDRGRGNRVRDIRDGGGRGRYDRDDRDYDRDRDRDRYRRR